MTKKICLSKFIIFILQHHRMLEECNRCEVFERLPRRSSRFSAMQLSSNATYIPSRVWIFNNHKNPALADSTPYEFITIMAKSNHGTAAWEYY